MTSAAPKPSPQAALAQDVARLQAAGYKEHEIADHLGVTLSSVKIIQKSPMFQVLQKQVADELRRKLATTPTERIHALAHKAVDVYEKRLDSDDEAISLRAADAVMDRVVPKKTQHDVDFRLVINIDREEREHLDAVLVESDAVAALPAPKTAGIQKFEDVVDSLPD